MQTMPTHQTMVAPFLDMLWCLTMDVSLGYQRNCYCTFHWRSRILCYHACWSWSSMASTIAYRNWFCTIHRDYTAHWQYLQHSHDWNSRSSYQSYKAYQHSVPLDSWRGSETNPSSQCMFLQIKIFQTSSQKDSMHHAIRNLLICLGWVWGLMLVEGECWFIYQYIQYAPAPLVYHIWTCLHNHIHLSLVFAFSLLSRVSTSTEVHNSLY